MRNRILKSAAWMLALCLPMVARAQQRPEVQRGQGTWEFSLGGGVLYVDGALRGWLGQSGSGPAFANTTSPSSLAPTAVARVGYNFSRHVGFSLAGAAAVGSGVTYLTPEATLTYTVDLNKKTSPFVLAGMNLTRFNGENERVTHTTWGAHAGLGVRHMVSENLALRLEGQMRFEKMQEIYLNQMAYNTAITLGISYFVGRPRSREAPMAAAPCRPCTLARVDTIMRMRRDTIVRVRVDTLRRTDTVRVVEPSPDQLVLRVQFQTDRTELLRKSFPVLDTIAMAIIATPDSRWQIQGHTDNVGTREHNQTLSEGRARTVRDYLIRRGVDANILTSIGYSESRPVFSNATAYGRAQNRRVQLRRIPAPPTGPPVR